MGENLQNQTDYLLSLETYILDNSNLNNEDFRFVIEGYNNITELTSNDSYLLYVEDNELQNISCRVKKKENNIFNIISNSNTKPKADLKLNNLVNIKDQKKNLIINFNEGESKLNYTNSTFNYFNRKKDSRGLPTGAIIAIILSIVAVLVIISMAIILLKMKTSTTTPIEPIPAVSSSTDIIE